MWPKRPASVVIDSATYLFTISSPDIDNVAMILYDIITVIMLVYAVQVALYTANLYAVHGYIGKMDIYMHATVCGQMT